MDASAWLHSLGSALALTTGGLDVVLIGRMLLTLVLCGVVGIERSTHERASGFRPHILVGIGACLMTQAGGYGFPDILAGNRDPMRLASYVISGIGFLGAGAILRHGATVRGLTTAASLWGSAGIGVATGVGLGGLAIVTAGLLLFTLVPLQRWEARLRLGGAAHDLDIHLRNDHLAVGKTLAALGRLGVPVKRSTVLPGVDRSAMLRVELSRALSAEQLPLLERRLLTLKFVERVNTAAVRVDDEAPPSGEERPQAEEGPEGPPLNLGDETLLHDLDTREPGENRPPNGAAVAASQQLNNHGHRD